MGDPFPAVGRNNDRLRTHIFTIKNALPHIFKKSTKKRDAKTLCEGDIEISNSEG